MRNNMNTDLRRSIVCQDIIRYFDTLKEKKEKAVQKYDMYGKQSREALEEGDSVQRKHCDEMKEFYNGKIEVYSEVEKRIDRMIKTLHGEIKI